MSIVRGPRPETGFTMLDNDVLRDERLSFRARGLLASILSRPDNWRTDSRKLAHEGKEGRAAILTALNELVTAGYIHRQRLQNKITGQWSTVQMVFDRPTLEPVENPDKSVDNSATEVQLPNPGLPNPGFPDPIRNTEKKNEKNIPLTPKGGTSKLSKACNAHRRAKAYCVKCQQANEPEPMIPEWCGKCDATGKDQPYSRMRTEVDEEGHERVGRCPECWPKKVSA